MRERVVYLPISAQYRRADIAHFGNIRGSNESEGREIVVILGRDEPTVAAAEQRAMAIWYDTKKPIRRIPRDFRGRVNYRSGTRHYQMGGDHETRKCRRPPRPPRPGCRGAGPRGRDDPGH